MDFSPATPEAVRLLLDGSLAFARMEAAGMRIDVDYLDRTITAVSGEIRGRVAVLKDDAVFSAWRRRYGQKTNIGSREQLAEVLFNVLGYPCNAWTPGGVRGKPRPSTDKAVLTAVDLPFVREYVALEEKKKLLATYLKGLRREVVDGYVHPSFNLHTAVTYRSSCEQPNGQNIPNRDEALAAIVRRAFIARDGFQLVEIDFSGIEVRVGCCYHHDPRVIKEFTRPGQDPHGYTAQELFLIPYEAVEKKTTRDWAKNRFVFPEFYGSVYFQCAPNLWGAFADGRACLPDGTPILDHLKARGIKTLGPCDPNTPPVPGTYEHLVKKVEDGFWNRRFKVYTRWKQDWWVQYRRDGGFTTLTGFRITWGRGGVLKRNEAVNYGIQGAAFHWLLWAVIRLDRWLRKNKMRSRLVGQIHDSMILDAHPDELADVLAAAKKIITADLPRHWDWICVPVEAEFEAAPVDGTWYDKVKVAV